MGMGTPGAQNFPFVLWSQRTNYHALLRQNVSWNDFQIDKPKSMLTPSVEKVYHPRNIDMIYWILASVVFVIIRRVVERYILQPFGQQLGVKNKTLQMEKIPCRDSTAASKLEQFYSSCGNKISNENLMILSKQTDLGRREIERWLRKRRMFDKPSTMAKFTESSWRFICYLSSTGIGIIVLWSKPWAWDISRSWDNYPHHGIPNDIWWYYMYGAGLYISLLTTQAFDVKRKDYWEMFFHHLVTIGLMALSWQTNVTRVSMYTLLLHDVADIFLEAAKVANYAKRNNLATGIFVVFTLVWIVTRLVIFPYHCIYITWGKGRSLQMFSPTVVTIYLALLLSLFGLHIFWTYFIIKVAVAAISSETVKDSRSSSEGESTEEETMEQNYRRSERETILHQKTIKLAD